MRVPPVLCLVCGVLVKLMDFSTLPVLLGFRELLLCVITAGVLAVVSFCAGYELGRDERSPHTVQENGPGQNVFSGLPHSSDETRVRSASEGSLDDESGVQVKMKKSYVMKLENRVTALEELLCGIHRKFGIKSKELDQERQIHSALKEKYEDTLKQNESLENDFGLRFQTERANILEKMLYMVAGQSELKSKKLERERQEHSVIPSQYTESNEKLMEENSRLLEQVEMLQASVKKLKLQLQTCRPSNKLWKNNMMVENKNLKNDLKTLQASVKDLEELCKNKVTTKKQKKRMKDQERETAQEQERDCIILTKSIIRDL